MDLTSRYMARGALLAWLIHCAAVDKTLNPEGLNLLQCNGPAAAQSVMHFHMHVLPRRNGDDLKLNWGLEAGDMDTIGQLAERIRDNTPG